MLGTYFLVVIICDRYLLYVQGTDYLCWILFICTVYLLSVYLLSGTNLFSVLIIYARYYLCWVLTMWYNLSVLGPHYLFFFYLRTLSSYRDSSCFHLERIIIKSFGFTLFFFIIFRKRIVSLFMFS